VQYELRQQVIDPRRPTFTHLIRRYGERPATRYEEGSVGTQPTQNFHYRPLWDPTHEIYDEGFSALRLADPDAFVDPRQYYYTPYVSNRAAMHEAFGRNLAYVADRGLLTAMPQAWHNLMTRVVLPLRYYEAGAQLIAVAGARYAYGSTIEQCMSYSAFDRIGNAQLISRIAIAVGGNTDEALAPTKRAWQEYPELQGLRRLVEELLVEPDWAIAATALDLSDRLIYPLLTHHLDDTSLLAGAGAYSLVVQQLADWFADQRRWIEALLSAWIADPTHGPTNSAVLRAAVNRYLPQVETAVGDLARGIDVITDVGAEKFVTGTLNDLTDSLHDAGIGPAKN
jgi:phenol/toluene 2-monooxygenase (NADH) P1/A1